MRGVYNDTDGGLRTEYTDRLFLLTIRVRIKGELFNDTPREEDIRQPSTDPSKFCKSSGILSEDSVLITV